MVMAKEFWYELGAAVLKLARRSDRPEEIVKPVTCVLTPFMHGDGYPEFFRLFEAEGVHLTL